MIVVKSISSGQNGMRSSDDRGKEHIIRSNEMRPPDDRKTKAAPDGAAFFMVDGIV